MNNQNNNKPLMNYGDLPEGYALQDDITRPILENNGAPSLGNVQKDPYLNEYEQEFEQSVQEVSEEDGRPSLPTLPDNRRLS